MLLISYAFIVLPLYPFNMVLSWVQQLVGILCALNSEWFTHWYVDKGMALMLALMSFLHFMTFGLLPGAYPSSRMQIFLPL